MPKRDFLRPVRHIAARLNDVLNPSAVMPAAGASGPLPAPPAPAKSARASADTKQYGASGTPIISGFVTDMQEYLPELRGRNALTIYEKMRRSDGDVSAILAACKLPIRAAEAEVLPGVKDNEPGFAEAKAIADDVKDALFGGLEFTNANGVSTTQSLESVIENALLCLDYGCSGSEDLWVIDGNKVRLRRIAPRLPLTFFQFPVEDDGETLLEVIQYGYRGGQWVTAHVPASKFTLFSFQQEGANFYGRSMLRAAYQHWYVKQALYRIDSIACERNGMGIPAIIGGENESEEDKSFADQWLQNMAANESTGLHLPNGWTFELVGVKGQEHKILPSIQHHSEMISRSVLAMFMSLGSTQSGSRALGNVMVDFFQLSLEATARFICETISQTTIRRYCDFNYNTDGATPFAYPKLSIPNIAVINPLDIMEGMKEMASSNVDWLQPDDESENWLRKKIGLPQKSPDGGRARFSPVVQRIQEDETGTPQQIEDGKGKPAPAAAPLKPAPKPKPAKPETKQKPAASLSEMALLKEASRVTRELLPHEKKHDFDGHAARQDKTQGAIRRILGGALPALNREAAHRAASFSPEQLGALTLPRDINLSSRLEKSIDIAHKYGFDQVYAERKRATKKTGRNEKAALSSEPSAHQDTPNLIAKAAIADLHNAVVARAKSAHIDAWKTGERGDDLEEEMLGMLDEMSIGFLDRIALEAARSGVAGGRYAGLADLQDEIKAFARSEAMDQNTCEECAAGDGTEWETLDDVDWSPGDDCQGSDACRGQLMPIFEDEGTVETETA